MIEKSTLDSLVKIQENLNLDLTTLANISGIPRRSLVRWFKKDHQWTWNVMNKKIQQLNKLYVTLGEEIDSDWIEASRWFYDNNRKLGGLSPCEAVAVGQWDKVFELLG